MQREINYTRKPLIHGNSCKVNALFNKGAHPRPSLFEESSVHLKISKTIGKTKETDNQRGQCNSYQQQSRKQAINKNKQTFRPMSANVDMGLKVLSLLFWFSRWFLIVFDLNSLVVLVSLVFPMVLDVFKLVHCMFKRVPWNQLSKHVYDIKEFPL